MTVVTLSLVASGFILLVVYFLGRTTVWGYLRSAILGVMPKGGSGVTYDPESAIVTFLLQLREGCLDHVKKKHGIWARFYGLRVRHLALIWVNLFIVFLIVSLLLLYLWWFSGFHRLLVSMRGFVPHQRERSLGRKKEATTRGFLSTSTPRYGYLKT